MVLIKISPLSPVGNRHPCARQGGVMASRNAFAAACAFRQSAERALEFVQPGMLVGVWRGEGKYFMHGFKKVGMFAARFQ